MGIITIDQKIKINLIKINHHNIATQSMHTAVIQKNTIQIEICMVDIAYHLMVNTVILSEEEMTAIMIVENNVSHQMG